VALIPTPSPRGTLGSGTPGDRVNLEADVLLKQIERMRGRGVVGVEAGRVRARVGTRRLLPPSADARVSTTGAGVRLVEGRGGGVPPARCAGLGSRLRRAAPAAR